MRNLEIFLTFGITSLTPRSLWKRTRSMSVIKLYHRMTQSIRDKKGAKWQRKGYQPLCLFIRKTTVKPLNFKVMRSFKVSWINITTPLLPLYVPYVRKHKRSGILVSNNSENWRFFLQGRTAEISDNRWSTAVIIFIKPHQRQKLFDCWWWKLFSP